MTDSLDQIADWVFDESEDEIARRIWLSEREVARLQAKVARISALAYAMRNEALPRKSDSIAEAFDRDKRLGNADNLLFALLDQPGDGV